MSNGHVIQRETALSLTSDGLTKELKLSEHASHIEVTIVGTAASSILDGICRLEEYDLHTDAWVTAIQDCLLVAVTAGTPDVANENTASTTAVVGGVSRNALGITDIDDNFTIRLAKQGNGKLTRLFLDATSGTQTIGYTAVMFRPVPLL